MKTEQKFEADLYRAAKLDHNIAMAMYVVFGIGVLVDISVRIIGNENHFDITTKVLGFLFPLVFCILLCYSFFFPSNVEKEKERLKKELKISREDKIFFTEISSKECHYFNGKKRYYGKAVKAEQKVWKLEWKIKQ